MPEREGAAELSAVTNELLAMADEDLRVRAALADDGSLFAGYHPRMRAVHERNAARLSKILEAYGWPGRSRFGKEAADAAWIVLQHAIGNPGLQRRGLSLLHRAAAAGDASLAQAALLEDRIRSNEGRRQRFGTQFDWDMQGRLSPLPIEDEPGVDARRSAMGLPPLAQDIRAKREIAAQEGERPPQDWHARRREQEAWLTSAGWRSPRGIRRWVAYAWTSPNTLIGLFASAIALAFGARGSVSRGVLEIAGGKIGALLASPWLGCPFRAMTLGHVILATDCGCLDAAREHEHVHVRQYETWGPLFLPAYAASSLWQLLRGRRCYRDNWFERQAFDRS